MASVKFLRGDYEDISTTPLVDGQLIIGRTTDDKAVIFSDILDSTSNTVVRIKTGDSTVTAITNAQIDALFT